MMKFNGLVRVAVSLRARFQQLVFKNMFPQLQVAYPEMHLGSSTEAERSSVFDEFLWFAAPKSKISPGRKREKHGRFFPKRVDWIPCDRCGEAKKRHRICTENSHICAMRDEDWDKYKKTMEKI